MSSIKTRIETTGLSASTSERHIVGEWVPLKQGLKPWDYWLRGGFLLVGEWVPLKQGLKLLQYSLRGIALGTVGEWVPLKQGLKQKKAQRLLVRNICRRMSSIKTRIETALLHPPRRRRPWVGEWVPLKQGLKQASDDSVQLSDIVSENEFH